MELSYIVYTYKIIYYVLLPYEIIIRIIKS